MLSPPVYVNTCHMPGRNTVYILSNGKGPVEELKCLKNKGKTQDPKTLVIDVHNCLSFARLNPNIIVNCTSFLDGGANKKVEDFPSKT